MASHPPRAAFSVSRRLSERDRREPHFPGDGVPGASPIGGMVDALRSLIDQLAQAAGTPDEQPRAAEESGARQFHIGSKGASAVFGYTLRMGLGGVSAERFGDVPEHAGQTATPREAAAAAPARQPIVEVFEEPDAVVVIAELPGADPASLVCRVDGQALLIEAAGARRYRKRIELPILVRSDDVRQNFQNGILEVRLTPTGTPTGTA